MVTGSWGEGKVSRGPSTELSVKRVHCAHWEADEAMGNSTSTFMSWDTKGGCREQHDRKRQQEPTSEVLDRSGI